MLNYVGWGKRKEDIEVVYGSLTPEGFLCLFSSRGLDRWWRCCSTEIMEVFEHMRWHGSNSPYARLTLICYAQKIMKHAENKRYRHYLIPDVLHSLRHGSSNWEQRKACICLKHVSGQCLGRFDKRVIGALEEVVERCGRHRLRHCAESALVKFRARVL